MTSHTIYMLSDNNIERVPWSLYRTIPLNNYSHCLCPAGFLFFFFLLLLLLALLSLLSSCGFISGLAAPGGRRAGAGGRPLETREEIVYMQMRETERETWEAKEAVWFRGRSFETSETPRGCRKFRTSRSTAWRYDSVSRSPSPPRPGPGRNWKLPLILPSSTIRFLSPLLSPFLRVLLPKRNWSTNICRRRSRCRRRNYSSSSSSSSGHYWIQTKTVS